MTLYYTKYCCVFAALNKTTSQIRSEERWIKQVVTSGFNAVVEHAKLKRHNERIAPRKK